MGVLCSLEDVELYLQENFADNPSLTDDEADRINYLIRAASTNIENICNRKFNLDDYDEDYDMDGSEINLNQYPVVSVISIKYGSPFSPTDRTLVASDEYFLESDIGIIGINFEFRKKRQYVNVVYSAGYSTIPYDLNLICVQEVVRSLNLTDIDGNLKEKKLGDWKEVYISSAENNKMLADSLDSYMRWVL